MTKTSHPSIGHAGRRARSGVSTIALLAGLAGATFLAPPAFAVRTALPGGGTFTAGTGAISVSGAQESVKIDGKPGSGPVVITWGNGYDVGSGGVVNYAPGSGGPTSGTVVNVDNSGSVSVIDGTVTSPDYSQVMVNPDGISVGATAVMPAATELAAGTLQGSGSNVTIDADSAPVTIVAGASFTTTTNPPVPSIPVSAVGGDTLPDTVGMQPVTVTVPAGTSSAFTLQPGQTGSYYFVGPYDAQAGASAPSDVSITGPQGGTTGSLSLQEPIQGSAPSLPTGTLSVSNLNVTGALTIKSGQAIHLSGKLEASGDMTVDAHAYGAPMVRAAPGSNPGATLGLAANTIVDGGTQVNLQGDTVSLGGPVTTDAPTFGVISNRPMLMSTAANASITETATGAQVEIDAPRIDNLAVALTGGRSMMTFRVGTLNGGSVAASSVRVMPAGYEITTPDYQPLTVSGTRFKTAFLEIDGAYGAMVDNATQTLPTGATTGMVTIGGADFTGTYRPSTNTANQVSIAGSRFDAGTGDIAIGAGMPAILGVSLPGAITINGSTLAGGDINATAYGGGTIDIGVGSVLDADGNSACANPGACAGLIGAKTVNFKTGNQETSGQATMVQATTVTGTANADPKTIAFDGKTTAEISLMAQGGTIDMAGTLKAGTPVVVTPVTGTGSGGAGGIPTGTTGSSGGAGGTTGSSGAGVTPAGVGGSSGSGTTPAKTPAGSGAASTSKPVTVASSGSAPATIPTSSHQSPATTNSNPASGQSPPAATVDAGAITVAKTAKASMSAAVVTSTSIANTGGSKLTTQPIATDGGPSADSSVPAGTDASGGGDTVTVAPAATSGPAASTGGDHGTTGSAADHAAVRKRHGR